MFHFYLAAFKIFCFVWFFSSLIIMWLGLFFFEFILFGDYHAFWICKLMSFTNVGNFPPLFLQMFFSAVISFSAPSGILKTHVRCLVLLMLSPQSSWGSPHHAHTHPNLFFLFSKLDDFCCSVFKFTELFVICFLLLSLFILSQISVIFFSFKVFNLVTDIVSAF